MLEINELSKIYPGGTQALKAVTFNVPKGQFLAVIGLSGSGKSTLLRCINRLIEPTKGQIIWNGIDLAALPEMKCDYTEERSEWFSKALIWYFAQQFYPTSFPADSDTSTLPGAFESVLKNRLS
jgi:ABC-type oligopeptide transport system ATPase subunit